MYFSDSHMHSSVSFDSETPRVEMARQAVTLGLSEICFTDHFDLIDEAGNFNPHYDWTNARKQLNEARSAFGSQIAIRSGIELGNVPAFFPGAEEALQEPDLDFVLCSVHNLSKGKGGIDFYYVNYTTPELCYEHLDDYFDLMQQSVRWGNFDVLAHIPYPLRYMRNRDRQDVSLSRYRDHIYEILKQIISSGKGIEVNTKYWDNDIESDYIGLLEMYRSLGGEIVTVGCDAHVPEHIGLHLPRVYQILRDMGWKYVATYCNRTPNFISLEE